MTRAFLDIAMTPEVRTVQSEQGSDRQYRRGPAAAGSSPEPDRFGEAEAAFIAARDSFYMATISSSGWPYVQHRGGKPGFLKMIDDRTLAFADLRGNRQYVSVGNLRGNDRACLFMVDYPARRRLKIYARVEPLALDADPALSAAVVDAETPARPERLLLLRLEAFDWNCPQHITPRYTEAQIVPALRELQDKIDALAAENAALRARIER